MLQFIVLCTLLGLAGCTEETRAWQSSEVSTGCVLSSSVSNDRRVELQALFDACAGQRVQLEGDIHIQTPAGRRQTQPPPMLIIRQGTYVQGLGAGRTTLTFEGDNELKDYRGITVESGVTIDGLSLVSNFSNTLEQSHLVVVSGPVSTVHVTNITCNHLAPVGRKSGDCIDIYCYGPDRLCHDVEIDHSDFQAASRGGITVHSGMLGQVSPTGHYTSRFHHNHFRDITDQAIDGEAGEGDTPYQFWEIDHNVFHMPSNMESAASVQIVRGVNIWYHDNVSEGRGVDVYGCTDCLFEDNECTRTVPGLPCLQVRKAVDTVAIRDEHYSRLSTSDPGPVISVEAVGTGIPRAVTISHSQLEQATPSHAVSVKGVDGLVIDHTAIVYSGPPFSPPATNRYDAVVLVGTGTSINPQCTDNPLATGLLGQRTTNVQLSDNTIEGAYRSSVLLSGSYCGVGVISLARNKSVGPREGVRCENGLVGSRITGPLTMTDNLLTNNNCPGF